jgi:hypothetical protein
MAHYLINLYQPVGGTPEPARLAPIMEALGRVNEDLKTAGAWVFTGGLHDPGSSTVVRATNGETIVTDGPFAEAREHIGGLYVISAADLDEALDWGRKISEASTLPVEVRPFQGVVFE